jgi:hypothetical protein
MNEREKRAAREVLYNCLANGRTTPAKAEVEAHKLGLAPLTPALDLACFDPMGETYWTLAMAVSWIAWADLGRVRDCLPRWREQHQSWVRREYTEDNGDGSLRNRAGWFLERTYEGKAPFLMLQIREAINADEGLPFDPAQRHTIYAARHLLWEKLGNGELTATVIFDGAPHAIPAHEWPRLYSSASHDRDILYLGRDFWQGPRYDSDVLVRRDDVLRLWPAQARKQRGRKPSVGAAAKVQIDAMRAEGMNVDGLSQKELAKKLGGRGVKISPRHAAAVRAAAQKFSGGISANS